MFQHINLQIKLKFYNDYLRPAPPPLVEPPPPVLPPGLLPDLPIPLFIGLLPLGLFILPGLGPMLPPGLCPGYCPGLAPGLGAPAVPGLVPGLGFILR